MAEIEMETPHDHWLREYEETLVAVEAERDAARALLRDMQRWYSKGKHGLLDVGSPSANGLFRTVEIIDIDEVNARIDAALGGDHG